MRIQARQYDAVGYLLFALIPFPNLKKAHGTGSRARAMKARRLLAHEMPRRSNMIRVKRGKAATQQVAREAVCAGGGCHTAAVVGIDNI